MRTRWRIMVVAATTALVAAGIGTGVASGASAKADVPRVVFTAAQQEAPQTRVDAQPERLPLPACSTYIRVYRTGPWIVRVPAQNSGGNVECILATGNQGEGVRQLQRSLNVCYKQGLTVDGVFGGNTRAALVRVQTSLKIDADGGYGPQTRNAMLHQAQELQTTCGRY